jgi:predicted secreted acid phosphatase
MRTTSHRRAVTVALAVVTAVGLGIGLAQPATAGGGSGPAHGAPAGSAHPGNGGRPSDARLTPRTHFVMAPDGSSGLTQGGEGIPNIDSDKKTIYAYYGDPGTGIANKASSPYITELNHIISGQTARLQRDYDQAVRKHEKPALVFDTDDTTLWTYDMEVADMHFNFNPAEQDVWVQGQKFPATPAMVAYVNKAEQIGYTIFGLTGRNDNQKAATIGNLAKVGYDPNAFVADRFYTKWLSTSPKPDYITCVATCTTVEYKAGTRAHIESLGYTIVGNFGDQWSDLQGGHAQRSVKLPNPTYYLPSPDLPGLNEPWLAPRTRFTMKPDGSSGLTQGGEGIPNIDSVKKTIYAYYGDPGTGIANKTASPYITELAELQHRYQKQLVTQCRIESRFGGKPAIVFDTDDTTLWTYDMEVAAMHFNFDPVLQDVWVQQKLFPASPGMTTLVNAVDAAGCQVIGLTGRNDNQKDATLANLKDVGYNPFEADFFFTKWTGTGSSQQPSYITCAAAKCTTIEYKSQTRKYIESEAFGRYHIIANFGDQYSDLLGGHAQRSIKLPNPTYYLP